jgi:hypothetical protein
MTTILQDHGLVRSMLAVLLIGILIITTLYIEALDAERSLFNIELSYTQSRNTLFRSLIDIYKAMGGGWVEMAEASAISQPEIKVGFLP